MIGPTGTVRVLVATKPVDFRKGCQRALKRPHLWAFNFPDLTGGDRAGDQPVG
jgi:hypothetical protein